MGVWKLEKWQKKKREEKLWTKNLCTYRTSMFIYLLKHKDSFFISLLFVLLLFDMVKTAQLQHLPACYLCTCISILKLDIKYTIFYYVVKTFFHFFIFLFFFPLNFSMFSVWVYVQVIGTAHSFEHSFKTQWTKAKQWLFIIKHHMADSHLVFSYLIVTIKWNKKTIFI